MGRDGANGQGVREPAKYYEPLYFYDGHTTLTEENQSFIVEALDKNSAVGIYGIFEEEGYPIYCMSGFAMTSLEYTFDELMAVTGGKFINLVYIKDRQAFTEAYKEETAELEFRLVAKKKRAIWVHSYQIKSASLDGRNVRIASMRVVDDSVRRESELLDALAKEYSEIIYIDENRGKCRSVKSATQEEEPVGTIWELRERLQEHLKDVHPDDHALADVLERMNHLSLNDLDRGGDYRATYRAKLNGEYVWLQFRAIFGGNMHLDTGHIILIFKRVDREVQKELDANRILSESLAKAEEASRIKNQFLSRMSHDLRTPLNGIMGMVDIIKKNAQNPDKVVECSQKIMISCQHLLSLVNDVLDMRNLESGRVEFENVAFDLVDLLEGGTQDIAEQAKDAGLIYRMELDTFRHRRVMGSPKHVRQIFANILDNAVKYNRPFGEITMRGHEVSNSDRLAVFEFVIEDTGYGMSSEFVKRIFEPFEQERNDARTIYAGTGLGMSIVKKMVDQMNGDIAVKSEAGAGTKVTLTLPFRVCREAQEEALPPEEIDVREVDFTGMKALLVEDNDINMEIARVLFENIGFAVSCACNGLEAVELFGQSEDGFYDIVFMDLLMPVMDGYEATRRIRAMDRADAGTVPIIALSANVLDEDIRKSKMAGMNEHLPKPIDMSQVLHTILKYIRKIA